MSFVHLHNHSDIGSLLDSLVSPEDLVKRSFEWDMPAVSVSDHASMSSFVRLFKHSQDYNIKPIFGCEFYVVDDMYDKNKNETRCHLNLIAKNKRGLHNLFKLVTLANKDGFYYRPRVDFNAIQKYSEGVICLTACLQSEISQFALNDKKEKAVNWVKKYKNVFGEDLYLEIMGNNLEDQYIINERLTKLGDFTNTPIVATNDVHYLKKEDFKAHEILLCIQTGDNIYNPDRFKFPANEFYFKNRQELKEDIYNKKGYEDKAEEALDNTLEVADKVEDIEIELGNRYFPGYDTPDNYTSDEYLRKLCFEELEKMDGINYEEYKERLEYELEIIVNKGYSSYFLIVGDFTEWAKNNEILLGVGRGSAAGCLASYLLGITAIDPIENDLLFQRFLNPGRDSAPDIDQDVEKENRNKLINYVRNKYGHDNVAQMCTFGTESAKAVIKDVGRSLKMDFDYLNDVIVPCFPKHYDDLSDALEQSEELQKYKKKHPELFKFAEKLEDKPRHLGTHAAAVVITPKPVVDFTPLARTGDNLVTQVEMHDSEELGMLKMDFLGLKTLDIIRSTIDFLHKRDDLDKFDFVPTVDNIWDLPLNDTEVYRNIYQQADTNGIFQVESQLFKKLLKEMKPKNFEHIVALVALGRPGTLDAGVVDDYFDRMHGKQEVEYPHEDLEEVLEETYGIMTYQEQALKIAQIVAGFSLGEADLLRRGIGELFCPLK